MSGASHISAGTDDPTGNALSGSRTPRWPENLALLCRRLPAQRSHAERQEVLGEIWKHLYLGLSLYLAYHGARSGGLSPEEREDLAAQKALDLLGRIVREETDFVQRAAGEIARYVSRSASNAVTDWLRRERRHVVPSEDGDSMLDSLAAIDTTSTGSEAPDARVERSEFITALLLCVKGLRPRDQRIWFLRVFYSMPSKEIARHPHVSIKPNHVDVLLQRSRRSVRECMQRGGFEPHEMPVGTFVELWKVLRKEAS